MAKPKEDKEAKDSKKSREQELQEKIDDLTDTLKRLQAEFENYKKRVDKEKTEFCKYAKSGILEKFLGIVDNFEIALKNKDKEKDFVKGMEMIYAEIISLLQKEGVRPIEAVGKRINPHYHEVLLTQKSDKEDGLILEELQKGYMLDDKVLRYSKVKVAKNDH